jgi:hypothetical protein
MRAVLMHRRVHDSSISKAGGCYSVDLRGSFELLLARRRAIGHPNPERAPFRTR